MAGQHHRSTLIARRRDNPTDRRVDFPIDVKQCVLQVLGRIEVVPRTIRIVEVPEMMARAMCFAEVEGEQIPRFPAQQIDDQIGLGTDSSFEVAEQMAVSVFCVRFVLIHDSILDRRLAIIAPSIQGHASL